MKKLNNGRKRILAVGSSVVRKAWANIALFLVAGVLIGSGVYLRSQPEWTIRADIREYNQGVSSYELLLWPTLYSSETLPAPRLFPSKRLPAQSLSSEEMVQSIYPHVIDMAGPYFEKAGSESTDKKLKSLALYNLGTMLGRLALAEGPPTTQQIEMAQALTKLAEAIRNDPNNEDAKFNLEFLEKMLGGKVEKKGGSGPGYGPGVVDKGY